MSRTRLMRKSFSIRLLLNYIPNCPLDVCAASLGCELTAGEDDINASYDVIADMNTDGDVTVRFKIIVKLLHLCVANLSVEKH